MVTTESPIDSQVPGWLPGWLPVRLPSSIKSLSVSCVDLDPGTKKSMPRHGQLTGT